MKHKFIISALALLAATGLRAQQAPLTSSSLNVDAGKMALDMNIDLRELDLKSAGSVFLTPMIISAEGDSIAFAKTGIYGRRQKIHAERLREKLPTDLLEAKNLPDSLSFSEAVDYTPELNGARPALKIETFGCANCLKSVKVIEGEPWIAPTFNPAEAVALEVPTASVVKERAASGRANVEFPVNRTELRPEFRNNAAELAKVVATIDSVKDDPDVTITAIYVKGFASPEGSLANNTRLAKGRTEALCQWIEKRYNLPHDLIHTDYEPEDWDGLREAVEADPTLPNRDGLLGFITDTSLDPDVREFKMRSYYPDAYKRLLKEIYPSLRHTDYRVEYTIRSFTSPEEILSVMQKDPSKLTAAEYFAAAQSLDPADPRYDEILLMAAHYDPKNEAANLNAASVSIKNGDLAAADSFLEHAGKSPAAEYTRGLLAVAAEDFNAAEKHLNRALEAGYEPAREVLAKIAILKNTKK